MTDEKKPDGGLAGWIEVLEDDQSGDSELLCLLLELRRHRENGWQARAEAFRALEQENILLKQGCENNPLVHEMIDWRERAEAAEAKLAELEKQDPVGYTTERAATYEVWNSGSACFWKDKNNGDFPLYARAAPAVNLADLVPDCLVDAMCNLDLPHVSMGDKAVIGRTIEVLRSIKESK